MCLVVIRGQRSKGVNGWVRCGCIKGELASCDTQSSPSLLNCGAFQAMFEPTRFDRFKKLRSFGGSMG